MKNANDNVILITFKFIVCWGSKSNARKANHEHWKDSEKYLDSHRKKWITMTTSAKPSSDCGSTIGLIRILWCNPLSRSFCAHVIKPNALNFRLILFIFTRRHYRFRCIALLVHKSYQVQSKRCIQFANDQTHERNETERVPVRPVLSLFGISIVETITIFGCECDIFAMSTFCIIEHNTHSPMAAKGNSLKFCSRFFCAYRKYICSSFRLAISGLIESGDDAFIAITVSLKMKAKCKKTNVTLWTTNEARKHSSNVAERRQQLCNCPCSASLRPRQWWRQCLRLWHLTCHLTNSGKSIEIIWLTMRVEKCCSSKKWNWKEKLR